MLVLSVMRVNSCTENVKYQMLVLSVMRVISCTENVKYQTLVLGHLISTPTNAHT